MSTKKYPLKFLDSYTKADTDIFFGREEEVDALYEMVFQTDIILIYGASGTGKTSLIQCGLASRFQSHEWLDVYVRRGNDINAALSQALTKVGGTLEADELDWLEELEEEDAPNASDTNNTANTNNAPSQALSDLGRQLRNIYLSNFRPLYLIFDQFEELYILGEEEEQKAFIANIKTILDLEQPVKLIFSVREEYLGYLYEFERDVPQLLRKKLRVEPMNLTKVQAVMEGLMNYPQSNISIPEDEVAAFTEAVFKRLQGEKTKNASNNSANPNNPNNPNNRRRKRSLSIELPYLQVFLDRLYLEITKDKDRQAAANFSLAALQQVGEIEDVLRDFLEEQVQIISRQLKARYPAIADKSVWQMLSPFVTIDGTKDPISRLTIEEQVKRVLPEVPEVPEVPEAQIAPLTTDLLTAMMGSKIIRYLENEDAYEIAHDALAAKIAEKRTDDEIELLEVRRLIRSQMAMREDVRDLLSERQLNFVQPYLSALHLKPTEKDFIQDSRRAVRRRKYLMGFIVTAIILVLLGTTFLSWQNAVVQEQRAEVAIQAAATQAALQKFKAEQAAKERIAFTALEERANVILKVGGCPIEIWTEMENIAASHPDSIAYRAVLNSLHQKNPDCK